MQPTSRLIISNRRDCALVGAGSDDFIVAL
jgi:hypothetical protein